MLDLGFQDFIIKLLVQLVTPDGVESTGGPRLRDRSEVLDCKSRVVYCVRHLVVVRSYRVLRLDSGSQAVPTLSVDRLEFLEFLLHLEARNGFELGQVLVQLLGHGLNRLLHISHTPLA